MQPSEINGAKGLHIVIHKFPVSGKSMKDTVITPLYGFVHSDSKKMPTYAFILLRSELMPVVLWGGAGPMNISCFRIYILFHSDKALYLIVIMQRQRIHFHIQRNFIPVNVPTIVFPELFKEMLNNSAISQ